MPEKFDIFKGFKAAKDMIGAYPDPYEEERKFQRQLQLERAKSNIVSPVDQARINLLNSQADLYKNVPSFISQSGSQGISSDIENDEDYIQEPVMKSIRGIPFQTSQKKLKPIMPEAPSNIIRSGRKSAVGIAGSLESMTPEIKGQMGPGKISAWPNAIGNMALNLRSMLGSGSAKDFAAFKSQSEMLFSEFRKFVTGAQAAYPELQMLRPVYPQPDDTPEVYSAKANNLMKMAQTIEQQILDFESQRGYRTGEMRQGSLAENPIVQNAISQKNVGSSGYKTRSGVGYTIE